MILRHLVLIVIQQMLELKKTESINEVINVKSKTTDTGSKSIDVRKYYQTVIKEHKSKKIDKNKQIDKEH